MEASNGAPSLDTIFNTFIYVSTGGQWFSYETFLNNNGQAWFNWGQI